MNLLFDSSCVKNASIFKRHQSTFISVNNSRITTLQMCFHCVPSNGLAKQIIWNKMRFNLWRHERHISSDCTAIVEAHNDTAFVASPSTTSLTFICFVKGDKSKNDKIERNKNWYFGKTKTHCFCALDCDKKKKRCECANGLKCKNWARILRNRQRRHFQHFSSFGSPFSFFIGDRTQWSDHRQRAAGGKRSNWRNKRIEWNLNCRLPVAKTKAR